MPPPPAQLVEELDADKDGKVTREEVRDAIDRKFGPKTARLAKWVLNTDLRVGAYFATLGAALAPRAPPLRRAGSRRMSVRGYSLATMVHPISPGSARGGGAFSPQSSVVPSPSSVLLLAGAPGVRRSGGRPVQVRSNAGLSSPAAAGAGERRIFQLRNNASLSNRVYPSPADNAPAPTQPVAAAALPMPPPQIIRSASAVAEQREAVAAVRSPAVAEVSPTGSGGSSRDEQQLQGQQQGQQQRQQQQQGQQGRWPGTPQAERLLVTAQRADSREPLLPGSVPQCVEWSESAGGQDGEASRGSSAGGLQREPVSHGSSAGGARSFGRSTVLGAEPGPGMNVGGATPGSSPRAAD